MWRRTCHCSFYDYFYIIVNLHTNVYNNRQSSWCTHWTYKIFFVCVATGSIKFYSFVQHSSDILLHIFHRDAGNAIMAKCNLLREVSIQRILFVKWNYLQLKIELLFLRRLLFSNMFALCYAYWFTRTASTTHTK